MHPRKSKHLISPSPFTATYHQYIQNIINFSLSLPPKYCSNKSTLLFTPTVYIQSQHFLNELLQKLPNIPSPLTTTPDINHSPNYSQSFPSWRKSNVMAMLKIITSSPAHTGNPAAWHTNKAFHELASDHLFSSMSHHLPQAMSTPENK